MFWWNYLCNDYKDYYQINVPRNYLVILSGQDGREVTYHSYSGKKKEPKPKLFGPDIFGWGGGLQREWVGAKKFGMSLETREIKLFGRDIPGFCRDIPEEPEKFEKKTFVFNSCPLLTTIILIIIIRTENVP